MQSPLVMLSMVAAVLLISVIIKIGKPEGRSGDCAQLFLRLSCLFVGLSILGIGYYGRMQGEGWFGYERLFGLRGSESNLSTNKDQLVFVADELRNFRKETGRYPSNDEGLLVVRSLVQDSRDYGGIWRHRRFCRVDQSGVLSVWGEPFIYENHKGLDSAKFADSGAIVDRKRAYSIKVDEGVFVWSVAAQQAYAEYRTNSVQFYTVITILLVSAILLLAFYTRLTLQAGARSRWIGMRRFGRTASMFVWNGLLMAPIISFIVMSYPLRTCYAIASSTSRSPELTKDYVQLIEKYHQRGIIGDRAYRKMVKTVEEPPNCPF